MRQILQNLATGETTLVDVPPPVIGPREILIRTSASLISAGTERMLVDFGKANLLEKARQQPDKVRQVIDKVRTDGVLPTLDAVRSKLDRPLPLGYCSTGRVIEVGSEVTGFAVGDRVASNGKHAQLVSVPANLCARVPDGVPDDAASFTVISAIALQGIRLAAPTLGETFVVTGMGLIGQITARLLRAHGCRVLAIDLDGAKLVLARHAGAATVNLGAGEDPIQAAHQFSRGRGVDGVIVTASTSSSEPIHQAATMCRKRGRIVLVGVTGLELKRSDFYEKELSFQVSCSYGPGRYDPEYEEKGHDYPVPFVRWTEQRNFEAVLDMMADARLDVSALISHRFALADAKGAYELLGSNEPSLGIVLEYPGVESTTDADLRHPSVTFAKASPRTSHDVQLAFVGAGNYALQVLMPAFRNAGANLRTVVSRGGSSGAHAASKFGFAQATTDVQAVLADSTINAVVIATRHDSHADIVCRALAAGKNVFVEKPLALSQAQLDQVERAYRVAMSPVLTVGFNRRFAPQVTKIKELLSQVRAPKAFVMTVNAGTLPAGHWTVDPEVGGGRLVGEACHFVDLLRFLAAAPITLWRTTRLSRSSDCATIAVGFSDGSIGSIHYLTNGSKAFPKERLEVFAAGRVLQLDNFRKLTGYGWPGFSANRLWRQDKGQADCARAFVTAVKTGALPVPIDELLEVSRVSIRISEPDTET